MFTKHGNVWASAGVSAGIDLALAMVEEDHGHVLALEIARRLLLFMRRDGGKSSSARSWKHRLRTINKFVSS